MLVGVHMKTIPNIFLFLKNKWMYDHIFEPGMLKQTWHFGS